MKINKMSTLVKYFNCTCWQIIFCHPPQTIPLILSTKGWRELKTEDILAKIWSGLSNISIWI